MTWRHWASRAVFLRALGLVYAVAFLGFALQARGLFGAQGILPIAEFLSEQRRTLGASAPLHVPSLFWLSTSDGALAMAAWTGVVLGLLMVAGCASSAVLGAAWVLYLSFVTTGQVFAGSVSDLVLLEAGVLAVLSSPGLRWKAAFAPAWPVVFLLRWLAFRVLLGSAIGRLRSDPCWGSLTCLPEYLETRPGPTLASFYLHALPLPVHRLASFVSLFVELVVPFGFFGPKRLRAIAGAATVVASALAMFFTNAQFASLVVLALALFCFDDDVLERSAITRRLVVRDATKVDRRRFTAISAACAVLFVLSLLLLPRTLSPMPGTEPSLEPLHLVSTYGVIEGVERARTEVVFEGTQDDVARGPAHWTEYELPCKPGDPARAPCAPSPYVHRFDLRLWQAALGDFRREPWVIRVVDDLLRENRAVTALFARDPFAGKPPRFVRAERYRYRFSGANEPPYWRREPIDEFVRPVSTEDPALREYLLRHGWEH
jgi:hypothetical protein